VALITKEKVIRGGASAILPKAQEWTTETQPFNNCKIHDHFAPGCHQLLCHEMIEEPLLTMSKAQSRRSNPSRNEDNTDGFPCPV
jgi:hypothetical protein